MAGRILPNLFCLIFACDVYCPRTPVVPFARDVVAPFEEQDSLAQRSKGISQGSPACTSAYNDDVELALSRQVSLLKIEVKSLEPQPLLPLP